MSENDEQKHEAFAELFRKLELANRESEKNRRELEEHRRQSDAEIKRVWGLVNSQKEQRLADYDEVIKQRMIADDLRIMLAAEKKISEDLRGELLLARGPHADAAARRDAAVIQDLRIQLGNAHQANGLLRNQLEQAVQIDAAAARREAQKIEDSREKLNAARQEKEKYCRALIAARREGDELKSLVDQLNDSCHRLRTDLAAATGTGRVDAAEARREAAQKVADATAKAGAIVAKAEATVAAATVAAEQLCDTALLEAEAIVKTAKIKAEKISARQRGNNELKRLQQDFARIQDHRPKRTRNQL